MSYILDALRKSEQERRHVDAGNVGELAMPTAVSPSRTIVWITAAVAALALLVAGGYALWLSRPPVIAMTAPTPLPAGAAPANSSASPHNVTARADVPPILKPAPTAAPSETSARDLAQEARVDSPKPSPALSAAVKPRTENRAAARAPTLPAPKAAMAPVEQVKFLHLMPPDFQRLLPALAVNIHIYAPVESERILYINNRQYQAGDRVRDDIVVEEIVEDGAVLSHHGQRFKLPRPR
jgi:general secretion pathway protein B